MTTYDFAIQKAKGEEGEAFLDAFFERAYIIQPSTEQEQRREIDRWFTNRVTDKRVSVEYKRDETAGRTGNAFIETVSVDVRGVRGWVYTSEAEWLVYFIPKPETIYVLRFADLRQRLPDWERRFPKRKIANRDYNTMGILVPLAEFERAAVAVY